MRCSSSSTIRGLIAGALSCHGLGNRPRSHRAVCIGQLLLRLLATCRGNCDRLWDTGGNIDKPWSRKLRIGDSVIHQKNFRTPPERLTLLWGVANQPIRVIARSKSDEAIRSEEHTSELQSRLHLVCRLLLEKKKNTESMDY